ncbi:MAG: branched-chain amino acid ABC transporter permease [Deltaproteobacteria bacterium]|nr:branched-chain amino acid ABC transporter permease [Deltaproteobacteria bacterium]
MTRRRAAGHFLLQHRTGLTVLCLAGALAAIPSFWGNPYTLGLSCLIAIHVIVALGLNLFVGYAGQISLGHGAFFGLGAYGSAVCTATYGLPPWPVMGSVAAAVGLVAWLLATPILRLRSHYLAMATIGFNLVVYRVLVEWSSVTGGPSGLPGVPALSVAGFEFGTDERFHYLAWGAALLAFTLCINLVRSGVGRGLAAVASDEAAAECLGVDVRSAKTGIFVLSAVFASLAGSLYAHYLRFVSPDTFGLFASLDFVTMVVVGGLGSIWGTLFGVGVLSLLPEFLGVFEEWREVVHGVILLVILILLPQGLVIGCLDLGRTRAARRRLATETPA